MTIDEIIDDIEYYISDPAKWLNYSGKRRNELKMMIEDLLSQNGEKLNVSCQRELLIAFYAFLEKNGKFPNSSGWSGFWADKYLESNQ